MINPTNQLELTSFCVLNCNYSLSNIVSRWKIYFGSMNSTTNLIQWILFENLTFYQNIWIFGSNLENLTTTSDLFMNNFNIKYWRFEVIYSIGSIQSNGLIDFILNSPPQNGTCQINPLNGTTSTSFTIQCFNWFDSDGIKDYLVYSLFLFFFSIFNSFLTLFQRSNR